MATLAEQASARPRDRLYERGLLLGLTLGNGVVGFDRRRSPTSRRRSSAIWPQQRLGGLGAVAGIALSSLFGSQIADRTGRRWQVLIGCTLLYSMPFGVSGLATTFAILLVGRLALGAAEG